MNKKCCNTCGVEKESSAFYSRILPSGVTSFLRECKSCVIVRTARNAKVAPPKERSPATAKQAARLRENAAAYRKKFPYAEKARNAVSKAVRHGILLPEPCFMCGTKAEAHHASYAEEMRLCVTWLCRSHHRQLHEDFVRPAPPAAPADMRVMP